MEVSLSFILCVGYRAKKKYSLKVKETSKRERERERERENQPVIIIIIIIIIIIPENEMTPSSNHCPLLSFIAKDNATRLSIN